MHLHCFSCVTRVRHTQMEEGNYKSGQVHCAEDIEIDVVVEELRAFIEPSLEIRQVGRPPASGGTSVPSKAVIQRVIYW